MMCPRCNGTGSLSRHLHGMLDCADCETAVERAGFNAWARVHVPCADPVDAWLCFLRGRQGKTD